jgi:replicative DNA helicase
MNTKQNSNNSQYSDLGKVPPQAIDLEEAVLGALMLEKDAILDVAGILRPESFYKASNELIYEAIYNLFSASKQIDLLTVTNELRRSNNLDEVGGPYAIAQLTDKVASAAHIVEHARLVQQQFIKRQLILIASETIKKAYDNSIDAEDLMSYSNSSIDSIYSLLENAGENTSWRELVQISAKDAERRQKLRLENKCIGIPTPLLELTKCTQGWQAGQVIVLAARPSMGKTAMAIAIMKKDAMNGGSPAFFSLETTGKVITDRVLLGESGINPSDFRTGNLKDGDWKSIERAVSNLEGLNIYVDDRSGLSIDLIKLKARSLKKKGHLTMVLIDYLQLATEEKSKGNREQEVAIMSRKCKVMAKDLGVPVILLSQLNRAVESRTDKRPQLADLRESGAIEQDADMVLFINRPEKYGILETEDGRSTKGLGELIIAKHKEGEIGVIEFKYNESVTQIYDYVDPSVVEYIESKQDSVLPNLEFSMSTDVPY